MNKKVSLTEAPILKSLLTLGIPMVLANFLQSAYQLIDALWVGQLGGTALAAVSVSFPVTFFAVSLAAGFTMAGTILIAQYFGAKKYDMVNHVAGQTMFMVIIVSLLLSIIGYFLAPHVLVLMGVAQDVYDVALGFMQMSFLGILFVFGFSAFQALLRGIGEVKLPLMIVAMTVVLNIFLDPLFIFGFGPIPMMGVTGAAVATICTQGLAMVIGLFVLYKGNYGIHVRMQNVIPDLAFIKRAFFLGFPASIEMSTRSMGMMLTTFLASALGTVTLAAYGIGSNVLMLVIIPALGLSMATSTLVGQNIGAKNLERAKETIKMSVILGFVALTVIGTVIYFLAPYIASLFVPGEAEIIAHASVFIQVMAWTFGTIGIQMSLIGVFRAAGLMTTSMFLTLTSQFIFQFPTAFILSQYTPLGEMGLWLSIPITNAMMAIITALWFMRGDWKKGNLTEDEKLQERVVEETMVEEGVKM